MSERLTKLEAKIKGTGTEPEFNPFNSDKVGTIRALNFYSVHHDSADSKKWALKWLDNNYPALAKKLIHNKDFSFENRGFICRMLDRGYVMSEAESARHIKFFENLVPDEQEKPTTKTQKKTKRKLQAPNPLFDEYQLKIDEAMEGNRPSHPIFTEYTHAQIQEIIEDCESVLMDMGEHPDDYTQETIRRLRPYFTRWKTEASNSIGAAKRNERKALVKKPVDPVKGTRLVRYMRTADPVTGLKSLSPSKVWGSKTIVAYDTEKRQLKIFNAADGQKLTFHRTTIVGFDEQKSTYKRVRKPEILAGAKITVTVMKSLYRKLTTKDIPLTGRFNDKMLILAAN